MHHDIAPKVFERSASSASLSFTGKGRYVFNWVGGGGEGGPGLRRGGSLLNIFQIGEGQTCFIRNRGRVKYFFARKNLLHVG